MKKTIKTTVAIATFTLLLLCSFGFTKAKTTHFTLIQVATGEVTRAGACDKILLYGHYANKGLYADGIFIEIRDIQNNALLATIRPTTNGGYAPTLLIGKFVENGLKQVYFGMDSGGSGGFQFSYVYSAPAGNVKTLFDYGKWGKQYSATYLDGYRFEIKDKGAPATWLLDISLRSTEYLTMLYKKDGTLIKPQQGDVSSINTAFPFFNPTLGRMGLMISQRVTGLYQADAFGYIQHLTEYKDGEFRSYMTTMNIF